MMGSRDVVDSYSRQCSNEHMRHFGVVAVLLVDHCLICINPFPSAGPVDLKDGVSYLVFLHTASP